MADGPRGSLAPGDRGSDAPGGGVPGRGNEVTSARPTEGLVRESMPLVWAIVILCGVCVAAIVAISAFVQDGGDRRTIITTVVGLVTTVALSLLGLLARNFMQGLRNVHQAINGRLTQLLESRTLEARATGRLEGSQAEQARGIVNSADVAIWSKLLDGTITSWNPAAERLLGWSEYEVLGHSVYDFIPEGEQDRERDVLKRLAAGERVEKWSASRVTKDGRALRLSMQLSPIRNIKGEVVSVSTMARPDEQKAPAAGR
jgi:PAS domain S-box-containing protein